MTIQKVKENNKTILKLDGWLDTQAAPVLDAQIQALEPTEEIILDFEKVEYIASAGLREVVVCHKRAKELNADLSIIHLSAEVMSVFKLTGLDKKLNLSAK